MNPNSHYKHIAGKYKKKATVAKNIELNNVTESSLIPTHIKINAPQVKLASNCGNYTYNIDRSINTNLYDMPAKPSIINLCIYRVIDCKKREKPAHPFLQYLLYKYPKTAKKASDILVFPFIKYKSGNLHQIVKKSIKSLTGEELSIKGFLEDGDKLFLFFDLYENKDTTITTVALKTRTNKLWWALLDEICNYKKILTFPVHPSVYSLFYTNPVLLYLTSENKRVPIPCVGYYGNYYKFIPIIAAMGSQNSVRGQLTNTEFKFFSSFRKAIRYGSWSPLYKERIAYNKIVTDIDGKYNRGGIVRFAIFLEKVYVPIDKSYNDISMLMGPKQKWDDKYNSLFIGSVDYDETKININPEYILTDDSQYMSLTYHEIDKKTVGPNWDPTSNSYNIL